MTADYIEKFQKYTEAIDELRTLKESQRSLFENAIAELGYQQAQLGKQCDHTYPDGKSASDGVFLCNVCKICGYCDL